MKIKHLLEAPARIHVNGPLTVLTDFIATGFDRGIGDIPFEQRCLMAQFAYIIRARTGFSLDKIIEVFLKKYIKFSDAKLDKIRHNGITIQQLFDVYNGAEITIAKKRLRLNVSFHAYTSLSEVINGVKAGHPIMVPYMFNSKFHRGVENYDTKTGQYHPNFISPRPDYIKVDGNPSYHHVLICVGVDEDSQELIMRDTRPTYLLKGYVKVPYKAFENHIKMSFSFDVDVEEL